MLVGPDFRTTKNVQGFRSQWSRKVSLQLVGRHILGSKKNDDVVIQEGWQPAV